MPTSLLVQVMLGRVASPWQARRVLLQRFRQGVAGVWREVPGLLWAIWVSAARGGALPLTDRFLARIDLSRASWRG